MTILVVIGLYILIAFINMFIMHKWSKYLDLEHYYEPKTYVTQDDYDSKSEAIAVFSMFWPFVWLLLLVSGLIELPIKVSKWVENKLNMRKLASIKK